MFYYTEVSFMVVEGAYRFILYTLLMVLRFNFDIFDIL